MDGENLSSRLAAQQPLGRCVARAPRPSRCGAWPVDKSERGRSRKGAPAAAAFLEFANMSWTDGRRRPNRDTLWWGNVGRIRAHAGELVALAPERNRPQHDAHYPGLCGTRQIPVPVVIASRRARARFDFHACPVTSLVSCSSISKWWGNGWRSKRPPQDYRAALMFNPDTGPQFYLYLRSFETVPRSIAVEVTAAPVFRDTAEIEAGYRQAWPRAGRRADRCATG